jgi:8-oxo-dGTP pyrophosphatase MutT (NUDIX family)
MKVDAGEAEATRSRQLTWAAIRRSLQGREPARIEDPSIRWAAVAVVLRGDDSSQEVLLIRRADDANDPWSGQVGFPGGRAEPGDPDLVATAVRETMEETGLDLAADGQLLGRLDDIQALARMQRLDLAIAPFVFRLDGAPEHVPNEEVASLHWVPLAHILDTSNHSEMEYPEEGAAAHRFPCLLLEGLVVWGLTYRMLEGLARLIG